MKRFIVESKIKNVYNTIAEFETREKAENFITTINRIEKQYKHKIINYTILEI